MIESAPYIQKILEKRQKHLESQLLAFSKRKEAIQDLIKRKEKSREWKRRRETF